LSPSRGGSRQSRPLATWTVAFGLATVAATIVGATELSETSQGGGGAVGALGPIVAMAYAAFTWIVAFPIAWLVVRMIRGPGKAGSRPPE